MKPTLWFVVPAAGRLELAAICLRQLRRTCDALELEGVEATAVVIADDENLDTARELGFGTIERDNRFLSRRFNDGIQLALDERYNPRPADYVVPCGSDDWVDYRLFVELPTRDALFGFPAISFVRPDGLELFAVDDLEYPGGAGMRIYPRALMAPLGYRPAAEDLNRACDSSILRSVRRSSQYVVRVVHRPSDPRQLVDWKTEGAQVTAYEAVIGRHRGRGQFFADPFAELEGFYAADALDEMRTFYASRMVAA